MQILTQEVLLDRAAEIARQIESSRAVFAISLDNTRNRIARYNLSLTMGTLSMSFSMMLAGFFGMNIASGLEAQVIFFNLFFLMFFLIPPL